MRIADPPFFYHEILKFPNSYTFYFYCSILFGQNHVYVSGGQTSSPYYTFTDENGSDLDLTQLEFHAGETYYFIAAQGFNPHPFQIGSAAGTESDYSSGGPLSSVGDELVLSIPSDFDPYSESLYFFCTAHTYMSGQFTVVATVESDDNESDYGYNDENMSDDNGIPVFYLSSANLDDLELVGDGYSEGNYIVDERVIYSGFNDYKVLRVLARTCCRN